MYVIYWTDTDAKWRTPVLSDNLPKAIHEFAISKYITERGGFEDIIMVYDLMDTAANLLFQKDIEYVELVIEELL